MDYRISIKIKKRIRFNCPHVKIHNETCLLFSEYILATLHIILSSHNLIPALKTHCRQMQLCLEIQETIYLLFHYASLHSGKDKWIIIVLEKSFEKSWILDPKICTNPVRSNLVPRVLSYPSLRSERERERETLVGSGHVVAEQN